MDALNLLMFRSLTYFFKSMSGRTIALEKVEFQLQEVSTTRYEQ